MSTQNFGFVRSTQIFFTTMGMFIANQGKLLKWVCYGVLTVSAFVLYVIYSDNVQSWTVFAKYYWVKFLMGISTKVGTDSIVVSWGKSEFETSYAKFVSDVWTQGVVGSVWHDIILVGIMAGIAIIGILVFLTWIFTSKGQKIKDNKFIRGMRLASNQELVQEMKEKKRVGGFYIPAVEEKGNLLKIPFTPQFERAHMLVHGTTGSGKGQFFMHLLDQIQAARDKAIIYDKGNAYIQRYYNPARGDIILNCMDERCANWGMWKDAPTSQLMDNIAAALIPQQGNAAEPFWVNAARVIFSSVAQILQKAPDEERTLENLLNILLIKELNNLAAYLQNTEAATLSSEKLEKMAISIRSILVTYCRSLRYLIPVNKKHGLENKFSIRSWLQDKSNKGWLFITCREEEKEVLKPLISVRLDTAVSVMMSMPIDYTGRTWMIYDEVASLQKLPSLTTGLAEIRKFGGCMILGMQSFAQLRSIYGNDDAQGIFSLLNTRLYFKSPDGDTAKLVSIELGEQDIEEARENYSYGTESVRDGISLGTHRITRRLVDYSEVLILDELEFYLRLMGNLPVTKIKLLKNIIRPVAAPAFIEIKAPEKGEVEINLDEIQTQLGSGNTLATFEEILNKNKASESDKTLIDNVHEKNDEEMLESVMAPEEKNAESHDYITVEAPPVKNKVRVKKKLAASKRSKKTAESKTSAKGKPSSKGTGLASKGMISSKVTLKKGDQKELIGDTEKTIEKSNVNEDMELVAAKAPELNESESILQSKLIPLSIVD